MPWRKCLVNTRPVPGWWAVLTAVSSGSMKRSPWPTIGRKSASLHSLFTDWLLSWLSYTRLSFQFVFKSQSCRFQEAWGQEPSTAGGKDGAGWSRQGCQSHRHRVCWPGLWCGHRTTVSGQCQTVEWSYTSAAYTTSANLKITCRTQILLVILVTCKQFDCFHSLC